jgi:magnesium-protoporphyrin IX monomethyl ester (oxidative) cyclase
LKFVKEISSETITMLGGSNCEVEMGKTTHKLFPFIDYVVSGYADHLITELCNKIFTYGKDMPADEVPDQVFAPVFREKEYKNVREHRELHNTMKLSELPVPDYHDYFEKLNSLPRLNGKILPAIPIESSRGCYWGKCKFCGLRTAANYNQKDWEQVYNEIFTLMKTHKVRAFMFCDNAVNFNKLSGMLDKLINDHFNLQMWAEVRVELTKERLKKMKEAGVTMLQVGVESLNDNHLEFMRKGSTMLQNIQVIKWSHQYGIFIYYLLMHGFPFEKDEWFRELSDLIPLLVHFQPPRSITKLRFDRFSDYHLNPSKYGLDLKAREIYSHIYPYDQQTINSLAYYFEDKREARMRRNPILYRLFGKSKRNFNRFHNMINDWIKSYFGEAPFRLTYEIGKNNISIHDTRPISFMSDFVLNELEGEIFLFSDKAKSIEEIHNNFGSKYKITDIENAVNSLVDKKIVLKHKNKLLALAVEAPVPTIHKTCTVGAVTKD